MEGGAVRSGLFATTGLVCFWFFQLFVWDSYFPLRNLEMDTGATGATRPRMAFSDDSASTGVDETPLLRGGIHFQETPSASTPNSAATPWWSRLKFISLSPRGGDADQREELGEGNTQVDDMEYGIRHAQGLSPASSGKMPMACCSYRCGGLMLLLLALSMFASFHWVVPSVGQVIMNDSTLVVQRMHMKEPTRDTITLNCSVELHDIGQISSVLHGDRMEIVHDGYVLGNMEFPTLHIAGGEVLSFTMESPMTVTNVTAFTQATAKILQGYGGVWYIRGRPRVSVSLLGFIDKSFHVDLDKEFLVPATLLEGVSGHDIELLPQSTHNTLNVSAVTTIFTSSILELFHLGLFVFDFEVLIDENGALMQNYSDLSAGTLIKLGKIHIEDFDLRQGINEIEAIGQVIKSNDAIQLSALSQFFSNYVNGITQEALLRGPTEAASPLLTHVVTQRFAFEGMTQKPPIDASYINEQTMNGFSVKLPNRSKPVHYRGTDVVAHNPFAVNISQSNIVTQVLFSEPLAYKLKNPLLGTWQCPSSRDMAELYSTPGMYRGEPERPAIIEMGPRQAASFFLPGSTLR